MATRNILNYEGQVIGEMDMPDETSEEIWAAKLGEYAKPPMTPQEELVAELLQLKDRIAARAERLKASGLINPDTADEFKVMSDSYLDEMKSQVEES